ncbi:uncharacterized protein LOC143912667 [Arctopsyche grandis]|uniref:uncharacterized protein LOC143912667 n=1 Tax=Arctopsyche grandis TaxID=121162 RepID=UPI00406D960C
MNTRDSTKVKRGHWGIYMKPLKENETKRNLPKLPYKPPKRIETLEQRERRLINQRNYYNKITKVRISKKTVKDEAKQNETEKLEGRSKTEKEYDHHIKQEIPAHPQVNHSNNIQRISPDPSSIEESSNTCPVAFADEITEFSDYIRTMILSVNSMPKNQQVIALNLILKTIQYGIDDKLIENTTVGTMTWVIPMKYKRITKYS